MIFIWTIKNIIDINLKEFLLIQSNFWWIISRIIRLRQLDGYSGQVKLNHKNNNLKRIKSIWPEQINK